MIDGVTPCGVNWRPKMAMDKRWNEVFERLEGIENELATMNADKGAKPAKALPTKKKLMSIKGVGEQTADAILELLS